MITSLGDKKLTTDNEDYWIAPDANIIGSVHLAKDASVWFNCTLRADNEPIIIGEGSNVQDGSIIHTDPGFKCTVGKFVTIGHMAMLHGCEIGDGSFVGSSYQYILNSKIGKNCIIGAKALITENMVVPDGSMVLGMPGKIKKQLTEEEQMMPALNAHHYIENYKKYKNIK